MTLVCRYCRKKVYNPKQMEDHKLECHEGREVYEMGHAFKLMVFIEGPNGYTSHEVLHYTGEDAAEDSFTALAKFPANGWKVSVLKLYEPPKRYSRG